MDLLVEDLTIPNIPRIDGTPMDIYIGFMYHTYALFPLFTTLVSDDPIVANNSVR
jgi:hypothetical protein